MSIGVDQIAELVARAFPAEQVREVLALLSDYGAEKHEAERERVWRAIVCLSAGDLNELRHFIAAAKADYRDVLFWAETPDA